MTINPPGITPQTLPHTETYGSEETVTVTAAPAPNWGFKEWTGAVSGTSASVNVTMDDDKTVNAVFYRTTLTVTSSGEGQVTTDPYGTTQTPTFSEDYEPGESVSLTAVPAPGWAFREWTGAATGISTSTSVTMDDDKTVNAVFEQIQLTVNKHGEGTVTPPGGGETLPHTITYSSAQNVSLSASPATGWGFKFWTGDASGTNPNTSVFVDSQQSVTAHFDQAELTVDKEGEGTVSVSPPGGAQALPYTGTYGYGEEVTLTPTGATGWQFDHWEGNVPSGDATTNPLDLELNGDKDLTAVFYVRLKVNDVDHATIDAPLDFLSWLFPGSSVQLSSTPDAGYEIGFWKIVKQTSSGGQSEGLTQSMMESEDNVEYLPGEDVGYSVFLPTDAEPVPRPVGTKQLLVEHGFGGYVDVSYDAGDLIEVSDDGRLYLFVEDAQVTVEGIADQPGFVFDEWEGDIVPHAPDTNPITLTMNQDRQVKALFTNEAELTLEVDRGGTVQVVPPDQNVESSFSYIYAVNDLVTLTASPDPCGWAFDHWEGDGVPQGEEASNPLDLTMDGDKNVNAVFSRSGEYAEIDLLVLRPTANGVDATHLGNDQPADQVFSPIITTGDQIYMNGGLSITDSEYRLVGVKMELQEYDSESCESTALSETPPFPFTERTSINIRSTEVASPNFGTLPIPSGVVDLTTYRIVIYAKVKHIASGAESWDSVWDTTAETNAAAVEVAHTIAGEESSIAGYKEVAGSIKARWTFPYMEENPYDFSRVPGKEMIRFAESIMDVARNSQIYNAAGKTGPALNERHQEARVEAVEVLSTGGDKDNPAAYIAGGVYFFADDESAQQGNSQYEFIQDAVAQGLLNLQTTQGNEYYYAVSPTGWTFEFLKDAYDADPNDRLNW